jgi:hypothetical protein
LHAIYITSAIKHLDLKYWLEIVKEIKTASEDNLVMFPSSKKFPIFDEEILTDPLQELLDEFSDIDIDLNETCDEFDLDVNLEPVLEKGNKSLIVEKINLLKDTQKRIKFLIDEIELYLPRK